MIGKETRLSVPETGVSQERRGLSETVPLAVTEFLQFRLFFLLHFVIPVQL